MKVVQVVRILVALEVLWAVLGEMVVEEVVVGLLFVYFVIHLGSWGSSGGVPA